MTPTEDPQRYQRLERELARADLEVGCAEAHGLLCGLLCAHHRDPQQRWLDELLEQTAEADLLVTACRRALEQLYRETQSEFDDPGLGFRPLLPNDDQPLQQRAKALVDWCQGFLYGIGLCGLEQNSLSADTREALADFTQIARMDTQRLEGSQQDQEAFWEVSEFIWVAAMMLFHELGGKDP